jgi:ABC-2 type transport system permease protein
MNSVFAVFRREMKAYFTSPIAYVVIGVFLLLGGYFFHTMLAWFLKNALQQFEYAQMYQMAPPPMNINDMVIRSLLGTMAITILFIMPLITMRLIAEEKKNGTIELLMTSPITPTQWVLGKYLASVVLLLCMILPNFGLVCLLFMYGNPEFLPVLSGYLGLILMGASFLSVGTMISSFTENQIVAGAVSFFAFLMFWVIDFVSELGSGPLYDFIGYMSMISHFDGFAKGVIDTSSLVFYLSVIGLGLFFTRQQIESLRWRL